MKIQIILIIFSLFFSCKNNKTTNKDNDKSSKGYSLTIQNVNKIGYNKFMLDVEIKNNTHKTIWFPPTDNEIIFFMGYHPNSYEKNSYYLKIYDKQNKRIYPDNIINCYYCDSINKKRNQLQDSLGEINDYLKDKINKNELIEKDYLWLVKNKLYRNNLIIIKPKSTYRSNVLLDLNYSIWKDLITHGSTYHTFYENQEVIMELILYSNKDAHHYLTKSQRDSLENTLGFKNIVYDTLISNKVKLFVDEYKE